MQLTDKQAKRLRVARRFRASPPKLFWYVKSYWRSYLFLSALGAFAIGIFAWAGWPIVAGFFAGLVLGTFVRDFRWYKQFVEGWPLTNEITNWDRVDELLGDTSQTKALTSDSGSRDLS